MSDHPKEADRNLKRIRICDDIYFDVFRLLAPEKVGLELALVSDRFDALVDTHFKSRKWTLGNLRIWSENIDKMNDDETTKKTLSFPQKPLLNSIVGFSSVDFRCLTNSAHAVDFLQCIGRLLESNVCLALCFYKESDWNTFATSVWPLLNVSAIIKIHFGCSFVFLRRLISPYFFRDCTNLRFFFTYDQFLQFPPDDIEGSSDGQVLCKWLHTPRADGRPKVLATIFRDENEVTMDALKTTFLNATTSVCFIIRIHSFVPLGSFELVNSLTREQLTRRKMGSGARWLIERRSIDKSAKQWAEWEKEALEGENYLKEVIIYHVQLK